MPEMVGNGLKARVYMYNCVVTQNGWESENESGYWRLFNDLLSNSRIWNSIIWGNLGENKIQNNVNVSIDYSIIEGGLSDGIHSPKYYLGRPYSSLNPQFNNPESYDFLLIHSNSNAGHVLNNEDPNQFF